MPTSERDILHALGFYDAERFQTYHRLVEIIGQEAADKLLREFPAGTVYLPKLALKYPIYAKLYREWEDGASYDDLGRRYGFGRTHCRYIVKQIRQALYRKKEPI